MIQVDVAKEANFPVASRKVKEIVKKTLTANGIISDCEVSVAIVRRKHMAEYVAKYYADGTDHPVLSFPSSETPGRFVFPPNGKLYLGEIIISYDWAFDEAGKKNCLPEDVVCELAEHGTLHLLGIHHD